MADSGNYPDPNQTNTISSRQKPTGERTITITIPKIKRPKFKFRDILTRGEYIFLCAVIVLGIIGGLIGGLLASVGYKGRAVNSATTASDLVVKNDGQLIKNIAQDLNPSVVSITANTTTQSSDFFGFSQPIQQQSEGTGIIISSNGLVLTNRHVVPAGTSSISITLSNGTTLNNISVIGRTSTNASLDIAILKINDAQGQTLTPAVLGDSGQMQVGDGVVAVGNALGEFQNTVTSGIISGYGRDISASSSGGSTDIFGNPSSGSSENLTDLFQTDAAINEGNSGGPLVNLNGQVIGVNVAIASDSQNIGFAIPINEVKGLISEVIQTGKFERPFLGVKFVPVTQGVAQQYHLSVSNGAYIPKGSGSVVSGSAAAAAGLKAGDVITKVNGRAVNQLNDLSTLIDLYEPGTKVSLTIVNGNQTRTVSVKLGVAPE